LIIRLLSVCCLLVGFLPAILAQNDTAAEPVVGLRDNRPRAFALQHALVISEPGKTIDDATILIDDTSIVAVGREINVPAGFMAIDCSGKRIYAGLIDAYSETDVPNPDSPAGHWNKNITPERNAASIAAKSIDNPEQLRSQGITARLVAPGDGIIKGSSCVVLLSSDQAGRRLLKENVWQHLQLTVPRGRSRSRGYPNSPMGAVALLRQTLYDAQWYPRAWAAYDADPTLPRPETNLALEILSGAAADQTFVIDAPNERMALRGGAIANEFSLPTILRGSGREYRRLQQIASLNLPILLPVDFPAPPDVTTAEKARNTSLQELMHWEFAPQNPSLLAAAGVPVCLTTDGLDKPTQFLKQVRKAVEHGFDPLEALTAMTTRPAALLGIDGQLGRLSAGMLANLIVTDGDLFDDETKVLETWIAGEQFVNDPPKNAVADPWLGSWRLRSPRLSLVATFTSRDGKKVTGNLRPDQQSEQAVKCQSISHSRFRLDATVNLSGLGDEYPTGVSRLTLNWVASTDHSDRSDSTDPTDRFATVTLPDGETIRLNVNGLAEESESDGDQPPTDESTAATADDETIPRLFPLGAYGLERSIRQQPTVLFRGATVWTCGPDGVLDAADLLIREGIIAEVGVGLRAPEGCQIIDARGKHITPGMIDCHSHIASDGGINESGQAVTAEVRIGDFIDNSDMAIYRQLAGGTTTSNILHGSANPIGGQNQVLKFRWGETMDGLRMKEAPPGIKFALGENVKRNTSRYPNTRMGVEQIIRDQLLAAREYAARWKRWRDGQRDELPPRRDLQLDAMAEVQHGERWIHCHSYRQDEIVATLDVLDEFGVQIGTLQHILEGYKVADRMAAHGAMGSSFSDWWAYKFEVFDAIPHNGALMHEQGIVVSFNSDNSELGRRLNTEAAKATKYGGVSEAEALKFVTLNPAKQLRIDQYVGSLEPGKHADLVVWSGRPLSTMNRCEQTWIDGRRYFSLEQEQAMRQRDRDLRNRLIQKILAADEKPDSSQANETKEEDRWLRYDAYCRTHDRIEYGEER